MRIRAFPAKWTILAPFAGRAFHGFGFRLRPRLAASFASRPFQSLTHKQRRFAIPARSVLRKIRNSYGIATEFALQTCGQNGRQMQDQYSVGKKFRLLSQSARSVSVQTNLLLIKLFVGSIIHEFCNAKLGKQGKLRNSYGIATEFALQTRRQNWR